MGIANKLAGKDTGLAASLAMATPTPAAPSQAGRFLEIDPARMWANPDQPRREFDPAALEALAESIREHGVLEPLLVRLDAERGVVLVAGERRWRAARMAGLTRVPCTVTDGDPAILALVENLHRQDLSPLEEAEALARLQRERGLSLEQLAKVAGKAKSTVSEILSLNRLASVREIVVAHPGKFPQRLLAELAKQEPGHIEPLAQRVAESKGRIKAEDLRAQRREIKAAAQALPKPKPPREGETQIARVDALFRRAEQLAAELLGVNLHSLNYRQRALAQHSLQPMARALDRLFQHLKAAAKYDAQRWTPERRARLLELVRTRGQAQASLELGSEIYGDGQRLHPSELAEQMTLARQEASPSAEDGSTHGGVVD
jgi:ParB family chromosome partitioning protein